MDFKTILHFWFKELTPNQWWMKDKNLDAMIRTKFIDLHHQATLGELYNWRECAEGALAEIIILDQFSRNIYRNESKSFTFDSMALVLSQEAIRRGYNKTLQPAKRTFLYLPFMHSESLKIHQKAIKLFAEPGLEENLKFEQEHMKIIERFGRYPHRNKALQRDSTKEEEKFLASHAGF